MSFTHILVAYDGSELSAKALNKAKELLKDDSSKLEVVYVLNNPVVVIGESIITPPDRYEQEYAAQVQALMDRVHEQISQLPNKKVTVLQGNPASAILNYSEEIGADVIILGSRGLSDFKELFLGSVSHNVAQHSKIPVLIIK
jgi:nucleotide-binding universal stress UspA family protein